MARSASSMTLKVVLDGDTRRVNITVAENASAVELLKRIRDTVADAFEIEEALLPVLKYQDEEGDFCTLVAASVADMLQLNRDRVLRLFASSPHDDVVATVAAEALKQHGECSADQSSAVASWAHFARQMKLCQPESTSLDDAKLQPQPGAASAGKWLRLLQQLELHQDELELETPAAVSSLKWHRLLQQMESQQNQSPAVLRWSALMHRMQQDQSESPAVARWNNLFRQVQLRSANVAVLTEMGFEQEHAEQAIKVAGGNVEAAVEFLLTGRVPASTPFESLRQKLQSLPRSVAEKLQRLRLHLSDMVANLQQYRASMQESCEDVDSERLRKIQVALDQVKDQLHEYRRMAQGGWRDAVHHSSERLQILEDRLADAQQFFSEALALIHTRSSEFMGASEKQSTTDVEASEVAMDTVNETMKAAVDTAEAAMASVDEFLSDVVVVSSASAEDDAPRRLHATPDVARVNEDDDSPRRLHTAQDIAPEGGDHTPESTPSPESEDASALDNVQVLLSQSISTIRCSASSLVRAIRTGNQTPA